MGEGKETEQKLICPNCGEEIKDWQIRCRNCGELLDKDAGKDIPEPEEPQRGGLHLGCLIFGLIAIPVWFYICSFFLLWGDHYLGFWDIFFHPAFFIPSIIYLAILFWFNRSALGFLITIGERLWGSKLGRAGIAASAVILVAVIVLVVGRTQHQATLNILHYDGTDWSQMSGNSKRDLNAVWGSSASDVFAVGEVGTILHYNGSTWDRMSSATGKSLNSIWGSSSSDIFAVGNTGTILRYDGNSWKHMQSGTQNDLYGIWGSSSFDVFTIGRKGTILHYDGNVWNEMSSGTEEWLRGVWGNSSSDVFTVGSEGVILHYDGDTWSQMSIAAGIFKGSASTLQAVWGSSSTDVIVVGSISLHYDGTVHSVFNRYDGEMHIEDSTWTEMKGSPTGVSIWGSSSSDVYCVGMPGYILNYDGEFWRNINIINMDIRLKGVWGSSSTDVFAVGHKE